MPRSSPFVIRLSSAEAAELHRRTAKYTLPYFQVQRAKMILMAAEGLSNDQIALRLDTGRVCRVPVAQAILYGASWGLGRGRPRSFSP
jgi:hypothetical protein